MVCAWLREVCSCSYLPVLPSAAWVLLSYILQINVLSSALAPCESWLPTDQHYGKKGGSAIKVPGAPHNFPLCQMVAGRKEEFNPKEHA